MKLIDKDALVAEIERRKRKLLDHIICERDKEWVVRTAHQLNRIILFIDTLEAKEVDLEKELIKWHKQHFKREGTFENYSGFYLTKNSQIELAKHFFELGLVQKNIENDVQKQKERLLSEIEEVVDSIDYYTVDGLLITIKQKIEELRAQKGEEV